MKKGWEVKRLGDVLLKTETVDPTKKPDEEFTYLDVASVNKETKKIENAIMLMGKDAPSRARKLIKTNDVIFATVRPTHSRVALITDEYNEQVCSTGYFVLRGKDFIYNQYLFYFLLTDEFNLQMGKLQKGANYPAVTDAEVKSISLRYPKSLQEQQRIVAILDKAFTAIAKVKANAEKNLKNSKEIFESYLQSVFENRGEGWEEKTLNQISENLDSKRVPITKNVRNEGSIPYYGASGIVDYVADYLFDEDLLCISEDGANLLARTYPIAFSISGKTWVNNHAHVLRFKNMVSQKFVELYLNSIKLDDFVSGMAQPKLNQTMLNKIPIPLPPLPEQQTMIHKLDALSAETKQLEANYQQKLNNLEELKKSLLQKAFNGELDTEKELIIAQS
ncbi:MAG: restriction endonuclease subunit S [Desulfamplus sp.]